MILLTHPKSSISSDSTTTLAFSVSEIFFERASEVKITLGLIIPRTRSRSVDLYQVGTSAKIHSRNKEPRAAHVEDAEDSR